MKRSIEKVIAASWARREHLIDKLLARTNG
jgi:hypothetical protein